MTVNKKIRNIIIFSLLGAIVLTIGIYSLVAYLNYESYRRAAEAALSIIQILKL